MREFWYLGKELQSSALLGAIWEQEGKRHEYTLKITHINKSTFIINSSAEWWCISEFVLTVETQRIFLKIHYFKIPYRNRSEVLNTYSNKSYFLGLLYFLSHLLFEDFPASILCASNYSIFLDVWESLKRQNKIVSFWSKMAFPI